MKTIVRPTLVVFALLTLLTGIVYPAIVTAVSQVVFPDQANGSLVRKDGRIVGSSLIAQNFDSPRYFRSRPSAATYNAAASSGSNLGPTNPALARSVNERIAALKASGVVDNIPVDLVTTSGSGLDPHISPAAAAVQVQRIAKARNANAADISALVAAYTAGRSLGVLGEPRVNVLALNLALDARFP